MSYNQLASDQDIEKTVAALKTNGIETLVVDTGQQAKEKILGLVPEGEEVMTMSSVTLDTIHLPEVLNDSGKYKSVRKELMTLNRETQHLQMNKLGAAPHYAVGSAQAVTQDGKILMASNTGSQLPAYAYGAGHVILLIGTQKIVTNTDEGLKRIYDYCLPHESKRMTEVFQKPFQSAVNKILIINKEFKPDRIFLIFVKEKLGF